MKTLLVAALVVTAAGALSACGSSSRQSSAMTVTPTPAPTPSVDAFTQSVQTFTAADSDTANPMDIDGIAATAPDTAEPIAIY